MRTIRCCAIAIMSLGSLASCAWYSDILPRQPLAEHQPARQKIADPVQLHTERLANKLLQGLPPIPQGALAAVTFTNLASLTPQPHSEEQQMLGLQVQESMLAIATQRGYQVRELRAATAVSVYPDHERILSRELTALAQQHQVRYVVMGTLNPTEKYTTVNARLVDIELNSIVAAASETMPRDVLDARDQLQMRHNKLYRYSDISDPSH